MDISVRTLEGVELPAGTHVAVRIGDVVKQGRYEPSRIYHFCGVEQRRIVKVDVFRLIGSVALPLSTEGEAVSKGRLTSIDPSVQDVDIEVRVRRNEQHVKPMPEKTQERAQFKNGYRNQGLAYISRTGIEPILTQALHKMLHVRPEDPIDFLCSFLQDLKSSTPKNKMATTLPAQGTFHRPLDASLKRDQAHRIETHTKDCSLLSKCCFSSYYNQFISTQCPRHVWERLYAPFTQYRVCCTHSQEDQIAQERRVEHESRNALYQYQQCSKPDRPFSEYHKQYVLLQCPRHLWDRLHAPFRQSDIIDMRSQLEHNIHTKQVEPVLRKPFREYYKEHFASVEPAMTCLHTMFTCSQNADASNNTPARKHESSKWKWAPSVATWAVRRLQGEFPPLISRRVMPGQVLSCGSTPSVRTPATAHSQIGIGGALDTKLDELVELPSWRHGSLAETAEILCLQAESPEPGAESDTCLAETLVLDNEQL